MFCRFCGNQLPDGALFCDKCGRSLATGQRNMEKNQQPRQDQNGQQYQNGNQYQGGQGQPQQEEFRSRAREMGREAGEAAKEAGYKAADAAKEAGRKAAGAAKEVGKKAAGLPKKVLLSTILAAIAVVVIIICVNLFRVGKPEDTVKELETALNELDTSAMLECFDEDTNNLYSGALSLGSDLSGYDLEGLTELADGLGSLFGGTDLTPSFTITVNSVEYSDKQNCTVDLTLATSYMGYEDSQEMVLPMKVENRKWVFTIDAQSLLEL